MATAPAIEMCGSEARVGEREPLGFEQRRDIAVAGGACDLHRRAVRVHLEHRGQPVERDEHTVGVGDVVEAVPRPEEAH